MKTLIAIAATFLFVVTGRLPAQVLSGPLTNASNGHVYYLLASTNWITQEARAVAFGGHLATIRNLEENNWVWTTFLTNGTGAMIGLTDRALEGTFVWISGETNSYRNWNAGEPNNSNGEDYANMRSQDGQWNDISGTDHPAVVEILSRQTNNLPTVAIRKADGTRVEISWLSVTNQLYQVLSSPSLAPIAWSTFGPYIYGNGATIYLSDTTTNQVQKFYRVVPIQ